MRPSEFHRMSQIGTTTVATIQKDWRKVLRTSLAERSLAPSAVAIIGEEAVTRPRQMRLKAKLRLRPSAEAASGRAPSQPSSTTSVAWIAAMVRLARISGQARPSVAPSSSRHGVAVEMAGARFMGEATSRFEGQNQFPAKAGVQGGAKQRLAALLDPGVRLGTPSKILGTPP